jgi:hypothetical protein
MKSFRSKRLKPAPVHPELAAARRALDRACDKVIALIVHDDEGVRDEAYTTLKALGRPGLERLCRVLLATQDAKLRIGAMLALADLGGAAPLLVHAVLRQVVGLHPDAAHVAAYGLAMKAARQSQESPAEAE